MSDLAGRFYDSGDRVTERKLLERALILARASNRPAQVALAACRLVYSYAYDEVFDSAATALAEAKAVTNGFTDGDKGALHICLDAEGQLLVAQGKPDSAIPLLTEAVALAGQNTSEEDMGTDLHSLRNDLAQALRAAGQTREAGRVQLSIVNSLDSSGYGLTTAMVNMSGYLMGTLQELGEFAVTESILVGRVKQYEKVYGNRQPPVLLGFELGLTQLRLGMTDSANAWIEWVLRDTTGVMAGVPAWMPTALSTLRLDQHRPAEAKAALKPYVVNSPIRQAYSVLINSRIRWEEGDSNGARRMLEEGIRGLHGDGPRPATFLSLSLVTAGEWRLLSHDYVLADSLGREAIAAAAVDTLALTRSAYVGRGELIRARALSGLGKTDEAAAAARRSAVALGNGYGRDHRWTRQAEALLDSIDGAQ
jgi:tetratricopeptide (TPR) repeat protein